MQRFSFLRTRSFKKLFVFCLFAFSAIGFANHAFAAGNIDAVQKYSQFLTIDLDANGTHDFLDWNPTYGGATVGDSTLSGYIWGDTVGWVNLNPTYGGVTNTCSGILGGYAWGQNTGWINFAPTDATGANQPKINTTTGEITGDVWSQNYGWIQLSSPQAPAGSSYDPTIGLVTSWHGCTSGGGSSGGGGGGSGGGCVLPFVLMNGVCQIPPSPPSPVLGCTSSSASNYNPSATQDNGTCVYPNTGSPTPPGPALPPPNIVPPNPPTPSGSGGGTPAPSISGGNSYAQIPIIPIQTPTRSVSYAWILPLIAPIGLLSTLPGLVTRVSNLLLTIAFGRKKARGVVFDSENKEPLDPAYVSVFDMATGTEVANQITDIYGRYGFILKPGTYKMTAGKTHYAFPSQKLLGKLSDEVYGNLYFGAPFTVADQNQIVTMNVPMDRFAVDWNQVEKERTSIIRKLFYTPSWLATLFDIFFVGGFIVSLVITYYYPVWWNILMSCLYVIIAIAQSVGFGPIHAGIIKKNGMPLAFAIVRAYSMTLNREIAHTTTGSEGGYYMLVPKSDYYLTIEMKNPDGTYSNIATTQPLRAKSGVISRSFDL